MNAGETTRYQCNDCLAEFEITFEPKAKGLRPERIAELGTPTMDVQHCPFCGELEPEEI